MADVIQLLDEAVANKIAAGEVVVRPASAVKELLENAIDAGATKVHLIVKDGGKTLMRVVDNGKGMSPSDARLSFARHATSKIRKADDLFSIATMGFRGEALASIAAVAEVEMKTRRAEDELGTLIRLEDSRVAEQSVTQCPVGTSIEVRNLFCNVPARRRFLKSDNVENRHILDEFQRVALANPDIAFDLTRDEVEVFHLPAGNLKQRIIGLFGKRLENVLLPVDEETSSLSIKGFVGNTEFERKKRGHQFFFVNGRFIRSGYLHHAVRERYDELIASESHPFYVLFIDIDPSRIDVNVHPTKQEIKFEDQSMVYTLLKSVVQRALGMYNVTPSIDFNQEAIINSGSWVSKLDDNHNRRGSAPLSDYNPFEENETDREEAKRLFSSDFKDSSNRNRTSTTGWEEIYRTEDLNAESSASNPDGSFAPQAPAAPIDEAPMVESLRSRGPSRRPADAQELASFRGETLDAEEVAREGSRRVKSSGPVLGDDHDRRPVQIHGRYILYPTRHGVVFVDQRSAFERILYERYNRQLLLDGGATVSQPLLFPHAVELPPLEALVFRSLLGDFAKLGYQITEAVENIEAQPGQSHVFQVEAVPVFSSDHSPEHRIEALLEYYKADIDSEHVQAHHRERFLRALAKRDARQMSREQLSPEAMQNLIDELFACEQSAVSPFGVGTFVTVSLDQLEGMFIR